MLEKTRAISLHFLRYKETSVIARFFTEKFGLQSFVVNGVRSSKSKISAAYFQPLQLLEIVQFVDERKDLHRLKEVNLAEPQHSIPFQTVKATMAIFIAELVSKLTKEGQSNTPLFDLVWNWTMTLDNKEDGFEFDHIQLAWDFLEPMGIRPDSVTDLMGQFPTGNEQQANLYPAINEWIIGKSGFPAGLSNRDRQWLLDQIMLYYQSHLEGAGSIQSLRVLREVFR